MNRKMMIAGIAVSLAFSMMTGCQKVEETVMETECVKETETEAFVLESISVEDAFSDRVYEDNLVQGYMCFHVPKVIVNGEDLEPFNTQMYEQLYDGVLVPKAYEGTDIREMLYTYGVKENVVSISVATQGRGWMNPEFYVFNGFVDSGETASKEAVTALFGYTETDFYEQVKTSTEHYFEELALFTEDRIALTMEEENIHSAQPYINTSGQLCYILKVYQVAGPDYKYTAINMETGKEADALTCESDHSKGTSEMSSEGQAILTRLDEIEAEDQALKDQAKTANSQHEMNVIAGARYDLWDGYLNEIWGVLKNVIPESEMSSITSEQAAWIDQKVAECEAFSSEYEGGSMYPMVYADHEADLTRDRVYVLLELLK